MYYDEYKKAYAAGHYDHYIQDSKYPRPEGVAFQRFPQWMWRNVETKHLLEGLRTFNQEQEPQNRVNFYGLDLYSLYSSIDFVIRYLERIDPSISKEVREYYECLTPWRKEPADYGRAVLTGCYKSCETEVVLALQELLKNRIAYASTANGKHLLNAIQNAVVVKNAEKYYRAMYYGQAESWNLRDQHMFETLRLLLSFHGEDSKAIIWAHNSHIGDAEATEMMSIRGEWNIGHLCRNYFGEKAILIGFGTDHGSVAAASYWDGPMEVKKIRPSHPWSYEKVFHDSELPAFLLHLKEPKREELKDELMGSRLERAIGVIYRPDTERESHYFSAILPQQFDEYIWFDETNAVTPLALPRTRKSTNHELPDTFPFGV